MDRFALVSSPYVPVTSRSYRQALCALQSDISSAEPCPFTKVTVGQRLKNLISSGSKKRNPDILSFSIKISRQANSLHVPQRGPYGERCPLTEHFYICLSISLFIFPSESPVSAPPTCSSTRYSWTAILHLHGLWSSLS